MSAEVCPIWRLTVTDLKVLASLKRIAGSKARCLRVEDFTPKDVSRRSMLRALPRLEDAGLVLVKRNAVRGRLSTYKIMQAKCPWLRRVLRDVATKRIPWRKRG